VRVIAVVVALFLVVVLVQHLVTYAWRARVLRDLPECDAVDRLGWIDAVTCFVEEYIATVLSLLAIPVGWGSAQPPAVAPDREAPKGVAQDPGGSAGRSRGAVVLVHGWGLNGGSFWLLRRRLLRDGWGPVYCFNYRSRQANVEDAASELKGYVDRVVAVSKRPLTLIGHSLGGLVIRYYARRYAVRGVRRLLTLGTPHHGTVVARGWLPALAPESTLLATLNAADRTPQQFDVITLYSTFDAVVLPPAHASYDGAFNIQLNNVGHNALLTSKRVYGLIAENLEAPL